MLLAEDLLLLLTDDATGKLVVPSAQADVALGGANLVELTLMGRVGVDDRKRIVVPDPSPTGNQVLDAALEIVSDRQGKKPKSVVGPLGKHLRAALYDRLVAEGILRAEESKVLGVIPVHRWPAEQAEHEASVRTQVTQVLVQGTTPEPRTAALIALLHALKSEHRIVSPKEHGLSKRELAARAKQVADGDWAAAAVRQAIDDMMAAVIAASTAATSGAVAGSA
jgi:hypothetical protein